ncbi:hypothetical protein DFH09DRAFT_1069484 [Mycena vulgaris]|nr:hypothetical protein DFH09DRAFT_1069484 [Mycena vulgaris]
MYCRDRREPKRRRKRASSREERSGASEGGGGGLVTQVWGASSVGAEGGRPGAEDDAQCAEASLMPFDSDSEDWLAIPMKEGGSAWQGYTGTVSVARNGGRWCGGDAVEWEPRARGACGGERNTETSQHHSEGRHERKAIELGYAAETSACVDVLGCCVVGQQSSDGCEAYLRYEIGNWHGWEAARREAAGREARTWGPSRENLLGRRGAAGYNRLTTRRPPG